MAKYTYHIDLDERGYFKAHVENSRQKTVWYVDYPDSYEICANCWQHGGECNCDEPFIIANSTIFEDGFIEHTKDVDGLEKYLKDMGLIPQNAMLVME